MMIDKELSQVKEELKLGFVDPFCCSKLLDFILEGSKFIRSTIAILYLKSQKLEINNDVVKILAVCELVHSASLLHDDVIDDAEMRRGKLTISKEYSSKLSILAGDYLLSCAIGKLLELKNFDLLNIFKNCTQEMTRAEFKQYFLRGRIPKEEEYIEICKGKTAMLFSAVLKSCALFLNIDVNNAKNFGEKFGLYFQIKNDLELESAAIDKKNDIYTAKDVLGIEKTNILLDNLKGNLRELILDFPENEFKRELEDLINTL